METSDNPADRLFRHLTRTEYNRVKVEIDDIILSRIFDEIDDKEFKQAKEHCFARHGWTDDEFKNFRCG